MPHIRSLEQVSEGFTFTYADGTTQSISKADMPETIKNATPAKIEAWFNTNIAPLLLAQGTQVALHVWSNPPLVMSVLCADVGAPLALTWWEK